MKFAPITHSLRCGLQIFRWLRQLAAANAKLNGSATERSETHLTKSTRTKTLNLNGGSNKTISKAIKRRAQAIIEDRSIDAQSRAIIRYGLEINDLWLPELVRRIEAGETIIETIVLFKHS